MLSRELTNATSILSLSARKRAEALVQECRVDPAYAVALSRSGGRCEYCGVDLLRDRLGYGVGRVDHLLPKSQYPKEVSESPDNWVLACDVCNSIKGAFDPVEEFDQYVGDPETIRDRRQECINIAREYIYGRRAKEHDPAWFHIMEIMRRTE